MKIAAIQDFLRSGGTERQSVLLANAFAAAGHSTTLLAFRPGGPLRPTVAPAVRQIALQPFDLKLDWFAPGLFRGLEQIQPDIALCMGRLANCYGTSIHRVVRRISPTAATICTMRTGKKLPRRYVRALRNVSYIVANSHDACETLIETYAIPPEKISVIHNSLVFPPEASSRQALAFFATAGSTAGLVVMSETASASCACAISESPDTEYTASMMP